MYLYNTIAARGFAAEALKYHCKPIAAINAF
jgi:hypothetical protein